MGKHLETNPYTDKCGKLFNLNFKLGTVFTFLLIFVLVGCGEIATDESNDSVSASWNSATETLHISGNSSDDAGVTIEDTADGSLIGMAAVTNNGDWSATASTPACEIDVTSPSGTTTISVENAPTDCTNTESYARAVTIGTELKSEDDIPPEVEYFSNPIPGSGEPNAIILNPPQDITIDAGQIVNFEGTAVGTGTQPPFSYYWDFGGAAPNSGIQNPGFVSFEVPGVYFVKLYASDYSGTPDPTPAVRTITVNYGNSPIGLTPVPEILSPTSFNGVVSVNVGDTLYFSGTATDSIGSSGFTFEWDFSGVYPNQFGPTPGTIPFNRAGSYLVSLYATNSLGIRSAVPATIRVNATITQSVNQAPSGSIVSPLNDVTINVGESLVFSANAWDPDGNTPLYYSWDFQNVSPEITMSTNKSTSPIRFNVAGVYYIKMTAYDAIGQPDPNPPVRVVTVVNSPLPPPGGGNGVLSTNIVSPPSNVTIRPGQSVYFSGQVIASAATGPLQYYWNFGGAAVDSNLKTPGSITFPLPGQYFVTFYAMNNLGNVIGQAASRTITVSDPSNLSVSLLSPLDRSSYPAGSQVDLLGEVTNSVGLTTLTYKWVIKQRGTNNTVFTSTLLNPGKYLFTNPGEYVVRFKVKGRDRFGNNTVATVAKSRISITGFNPPNPGPGPASAGILSPSSDMVIYAGNTVNFEANSIFGSNVTYRWNFGTARTPSNSRNPAPVLFSIPGTYLVSLNVTGTSSNGLPISLYDQRTIQVLQGNPSFPPGNNPTGAAMVSPVSDMQIRLGESVNFEAKAILGANVSYQWNFSGVRAPSSRRIPRPVIFNSLGSHLVTLLITGTTAGGLPINLFDQRTITVFQLTPPFPSPIPNPIPLGAGITMPATDKVIRVGDVINFDATSIAGTNVLYSWDFAGIRPLSNQRTPAPVQFSRSGSFLISVSITGTSFNGSPININDHRVISVLDGNPNPIPVPAPNPTPQPPNNPASAPEGYINNPTQSVVNIRVGQPVMFSGTGFDPLGTGSLTFQWTFGGARRNILSQNPGAVTFNRVGTFVVSLLVKNALGQYDSTPPTVVVIVSP